MKSKILIVSMILTIVIICSSCSKSENNIHIANGSAFEIEQNTFKMHLSIANETEQTSEPFKVKLKINNPMLSAALGFYEKDLIESDRSKSPFVIESYKEISLNKSFPLNIDIDESLIGNNVDNSDNIPSVQVEIIADDFTSVFSLGKF